MCCSIFRSGQWHGIKVGLYDLDAHKITKMVHFGGAMFFEMDDIWAKVNDIPAKSLTFSRTDANHIFNHVVSNRTREDFRIKIVCLNEKPVVNLQALIEAIPSLIDKKYFTIDYVDCSPYRVFGYRHVGARPSKEHVEYGLHIPKPRLFIWDKVHHQWTDEPIPIR